MIKLEPLLRFSNSVTVQPIGRTPFGERTTYVVGEGVFTGPSFAAGFWPVEATGSFARRRSGEARCAQDLRNR